MDINSVLLDKQRYLENLFKEIDISTLKRTEFYSEIGQHMINIAWVVCSDENFKLSGKIFKRDFWWLQRAGNAAVLASEVDKKLPVTEKAWIDAYFEELLPLLKKYIQEKEVREAVYIDLGKRNRVGGFKYYERRGEEWIGIRYKRT